MKHRLVRFVAAGGLALVATVTAIAPNASASSSLTKVRFAYDFPWPDMELIPVIVAQKEGFFKAHGLKVSIVFPPSTSTTVQMLATKDTEVALLSTSDLVVAVKAKVPVVSIANYSMTNNWGLFAMPGSKLSLATLKGKKVFSWGDTWTTAMLPFVLKKAGLTATDITVVNGEADTPLLKSGKVDFVTNTTNYAIPGIGGKPVQIVGKAAGVPAVPVWVYATGSSYAKKHGKTVSAFMAAMKDATQWSIDNQGKAVRYFDKAFPDSGYTHAYNVQAWKLTVPLLKNKSGEFFAQTKTQWSTLARAMVDVKQIDKAEKPSAYFTNKFLP
ncbi:MAG: ABC transporter substrate-binding protein [Actinomycetes bacterium]